MVDGEYWKLIAVDGYIPYEIQAGFMICTGENPVTYATESTVRGPESIGWGGHVEKYLAVGYHRMRMLSAILRSKVECALVWWRWVLYVLRTPYRVRVQSCMIITEKKKKIIITRPLFGKRLLWPMSGKKATDWMADGENPPFAMIQTSQSLPKVVGPGFLQAGRKRKVSSMEQKRRHGIFDGNNRFSE